MTTHKSNMDDIQRVLSQNNDKIGEAFRYYIQLSGLSNYRLAEYLSITPPAVTKLVGDNSNPTYRTLKRACKWLNCRASDVVLKAEQLEDESKENTG